MRLPFGSPAALLRLVLLGCALIACSARADLVWTAETGWRIEGGALSGLTGADGRSALNSMNSARNSEEKKSYWSAARTYEKVAKKYPNSVYAPEALFRAAKARLARKQYTLAFNDYQTIISRYPNTRHFNEIIGEQYRIASSLLDGARGRILWGLLPGFRSREQSLVLFENVIMNAPYSDYAPLALMNIARGQEKYASTEDAIDALDRMLNSYGESLLAPDAIMKIAQAHASLVMGPKYDQTSTRDAATYFQDFLIRYPGDPKAAEAEKGLDAMKTVLAENKMKMGDFYFYKRSNFIAARVLYNDAITTYPDSAVADRARTQLVAVAAAALKAGVIDPDAPKSTILPSTTPPPAPKRKRFLGIF